MGWGGGGLRLLLLEKEQNLPSPSISLACRLPPAENNQETVKQTPEKTCTFSLNCLKEHR